MKRPPRRSRAESDAQLGARLDDVLAGADRAAHREMDPVSFVHAQRDADDREVVALIAALLAFGRVASIRASIREVLGRLGPRVAARVDSASRQELARSLDGFVHRVYRGEDLAHALAGAAALRREHGSIAGALPVLARTTPVDVPHALSSRAPLVRLLAGLGDALRGPPPHRAGLAHLVPDVRRGSACKRLLLFLRWMCRPSDGIDLGLSPFGADALVVPLDTHIHRIAKNLRLTRRRDASLRTAVEITDRLARFDPADPVKYDFVLCHLGISGQCPSRRDEARCEPCVLRSVCRHWSRATR